jgi:hypothetical protein
MPNLKQVFARPMKPSRHLEGGDAELVEMVVPGGLVGKASGGMLEKASDHVFGQRAFAHVGDRLIIDDVIAVTDARRFEEVEAALGIRGAKPGEVLVADLAIVSEGTSFLRWFAGLQARSEVA